MTWFMRALPIAAFIIFFSTSALPDSAGAATTNEVKEIAVGTLSCKAEWNEFCEDQNIVSVPAEHKLCNYTIKATTKLGDSAYQFVTADKQSVTVKFSAKGNRDRFNQQGAHIVLTVSLFGVRSDASCPGDPVAPPAVAATATPAAAAVNPPPAPAAIPTPALAPAPTPTTTDNNSPAVIEGKAPSTVVTPTIPASTLPKVHACACSQWIDAGKVTSCLELGLGRDKVTCDTFSAAIQCVTSREECRNLHQDTCYQVMGLNQTTSQKRIFVSDSPYCINQIKK